MYVCTRNTTISEDGGRRMAFYFFSFATNNEIVGRQIDKNCLTSNEKEEAKTLDHSPRFACPNFAKYNELGLSQRAYPLLPWPPK